MSVTVRLGCVIFVKVCGAGRRVRAVVACARNDDCCSPVAKRKEQGGIVQFFEMPKGAARRKSPPKKLNGINGTVSQLSTFDYLLFCNGVVYLLDQRFPNFLCLQLT